HDSDIFLVAVVVVAGDVAVVSVLDLAGRVRKTVPDRLAFAVFVPGAFNLVRRGSRTPPEAPRKLRCRSLLGKKAQGKHRRDRTGRNESKARSQELSTRNGIRSGDRHEYPL